MEFSKYWPGWPSGKEGSTLVLVDVQMGVDELFEVIFGAASRFQAEARRERKFVDYSESEWVLEQQELPSLPGGFGWTAPEPASSAKLSPADHSGRMRKVCFRSARSMSTEELQRCVEACAGARFVVDCTVCTDAPYGDSWRTVCRYSLSAAADASSTQLRIDYAMAYAKPVSAWMRRMLEPAAESGLAKHFAQFIDVLSRYATLADAAAPLPDAGAREAHADAGEGGGEASSKTQQVVALLTALGTRRRIAGVATVFVDDHLLDLFLPLAEILLAGVTGRSPKSGGFGVRGVASVLSTLLVGYLLQWVLWAWHKLGGACGVRGHLAARVCRRVYAALDLPHSVTGLVMAIGVLLVVRSALGGFAKNVQKAQAEQSGDANSTAAPAGADDSDANNGTASGASNNAPEPTQQPNIHMQRLAAIGNFFIGRRSQSDRAASGSGHDAAAHGSPSRSVLASDAQALSGRNMNLAVIENFVQQRPASAGSRGASQDLGDAAPQLSPERSCAGALGPEDGAYLPAAGVAVDEVFENERRQPFRGWGHSWPGHFLPTDPVGHWCRASGRSVKGGVSFEDNALDVPEGWTACTDWQLDRYGTPDAPRDGQGWHYGLDYRLLPLSGPTRVHVLFACVRRRRWARTRVVSAWAAEVPLEELAQRFPPVAAAMARPRRRRQLPAEGAAMRRGGSATASSELTSTDLEERLHLSEPPQLCTDDTDVVTAGDASAIPPVASAPAALDEMSQQNELASPDAQRRSSTSGATARELADASAEVRGSGGAAGPAEGQREAGVALSRAHSTGLGAPAAAAHSPLSPQRPLSASSCAMASPRTPQSSTSGDAARLVALTASPEQLRRKPPLPPAATPHASPAGKTFAGGSPGRGGLAQAQPQVLAAGALASCRAEDGLPGGPVGSSAGENRADLMRMYSEGLYGRASR